MDDIAALIVNISTSVVVSLFLLFLCAAFLFPDFVFKRFFGFCDHDDYQKLLLKNDEKFKEVIDCFILIESNFVKNSFPRFVFADKSMSKVNHLRSLWNDIEELIYHIKKIKCDWKDRAGLNYMVDRLKEFEKIVDRYSVKLIEKETVDLYA